GRGPGPAAPDQGAPLRRAGEGRALGGAARELLRGRPGRIVSRGDRSEASRLDERALEAWGRALGAEAPVPLFLALTGPLGAGKSVLARAVARGAGVLGTLPSPTYNLLFRYPASAGRMVVHLDLYRIGSPAELDELGWDELGAS